MEQKKDMKQKKISQYLFKGIPKTFIKLTFKLKNVMNLFIVWLRHCVFKFQYQYSNFQFHRHISVSKFSFSFRVLSS